MAEHLIRCGIGGWTFAPWRGTFYPKGLRQADELKYAGEHLGAIEINGTYYGTQKPESFAKWREAVPESFQFSVKASRYCTNRKDLREAGESIEKFTGQGLIELGDKLGPLLWQFMPTKRFDPAEFEGFFKMLPETLEGMALRHAVEVRHESFLCPEFVDLARKFNAAVVCSHSDKYPQMYDQTADFSYARLTCSREDIETGYSDSELDAWAERAKNWRDCKSSDDRDYISSPVPLVSGRDVYMFVISGAKIRAPAAAQELMERIRT
ncbi:DUF72 domain-containing protein [Parasphingorhabdus sp.]|uniref:DUF72 domain-containing protein n=1 Tax=Parasphingorhabdus sp. TaxID=2709688 RepID=UPI0030016E36